MPQYALNVVQFTEATRYCQAMFMDPTTQVGKYLPVIGWALCEIYADNDENAPVSTKVCACVYDQVGGLVTVHQSRTFIRLLFDPNDMLDTKERQKDIDIFLIEQKLESVKAMTSNATDKGASN